jgi:amidohydrolase
MSALIAEAQVLFDYTRSLRRDFHMHPELGFQEVRTAGIVARELTNLGLEVHTGVAQTGVVALLEGERPGPVVLLRFDMDALPIQEETGAEYASRSPGIMHACGHDGHTAVGLSVARLLQQHQQEIAGTVKFVFQPAEEGLGGAPQMITEGILTNPAPDVALALHVWNEYPLGWMGISQGPVMAAAETFHVRVVGKGGHGAAPHLAVDPVLAAAQIITALQGVVARNVPPLDTAVVSVTTVHGGEAFNVIPQQVELTGTVRTFNPEVRERTLRRFQQVVEGVASAMECQAEMEMKSITPAAVNDALVTQRVQQVTAQLYPGVEINTHYQTMALKIWLFAAASSRVFLLHGSANPEKVCMPHIIIPALILMNSFAAGRGIMAGVALDYLRT